MAYAHGMKPPLALALLLLAGAARAGAPEPASKPVEEPRFYYHAPRASWWGDVVARKDISLTADLGKLEELCLIPPAADWVTDGASREIQEKYLRLLHRVAWSMNNASGGGNAGNRTIGTCGVNAYAVTANLGEFSNFFVGGIDPALKSRIGFSGCLSTKDFVKGEPKYASFGRTVIAPGAAVAETLNLLLKSKHPDTVLEALGVVRTLSPFEKFRDAVEALSRDKSVTAVITIRPDGVEEKLPLRVYAMHTLATMERTERTAKLLALIWHDEKEAAEVREGAIRAFSFVSQWPGTAIETMNNAEKRKAMHKALYPFLVPLMVVGGVEADKKEEGGPKAQLSPLGSAASCALDLFPLELRAKARKGEKL